MTIPDERLKERAARIRLLIFDVDGVLTDGGLHFDHRGREHKVFNSRDGHGMKMLMETGVTIAVITGRTSEAVVRRMAGLGIEHLYQGQNDKLEAFDDLLGRLSIPPDEVAYVGDDVVDLPVMRRVGLSIAVADAHPLLLEHADWRTPNRGGQGAARDACEFIMEAQGRLAERWRAYLAVD